MNGAPANPITGVSGPSAAVTASIVSMTNGVRAAGSNGAIRPRSAAVRTGAGSRGPSSVNSTARPIASSGTSRSENRIAASNPKRRIGCSVTSAASFGVLQSSRKLTPERTCRYSGR